MDKPGQTIRLASILFLVSGAMFAQSPRTMAQTPDTQSAFDVSAFWSGGVLDGKKQVFLTPGLVLVGFPLAERLHLTIGAGVQIAVTQFRQYNHRWIVSVRFPF